MVSKLKSCIVVVCIVLLGGAWPNSGKVYPPVSQAAAGGGTLSFVQNSSNVLGSGGATTQNTALAGTVAGNLIVVGFAWCDSNNCTPPGTGTVTSVTSSNSGSGETCTQVASAATVGHKSSSDIWYCKNIVGGSDTITVNYSATVYFSALSISEVHGASTSAPLDSSTTNTTIDDSGAASSLSVSTSAATNHSSEFVYSAGYAAGATMVMGQTQINANVDEYQISGASGTYTNTASWAGTHPYAVSLTAFK